MAKTHIIAFEGIDGSGKTLQVELLYRELLRRGHTVLVKSFPVYESFFGTQVGKLLKGDGDVRADQVDSKSMCLWYALDRWSDFQAYADGDYDFLLINRFVLSNAVYQSARDRDRGMDDNWEWVKQLEFGRFGLPVPDVTVILDVEPVHAAGNVDKKGYRDYVGNAKDSYEMQEGLQERARARYRGICDREESMALIECMEHSRLKEPEAVASAVVCELQKRGIIG